MMILNSICIQSGIYVNILILYKVFLLLLYQYMLILVSVGLYIIKKITI
jgi:hypothetical protein